MDRNDERERDEQRRGAEQEEPRDERRPPRRYEQAPEVVQDALDPKLLKSGKRAYRTDTEGTFEVVDWGVAIYDGKCRSVRLKPTGDTHGRTEWVSVRFVRLSSEETH